MRYKTIRWSAFPPHAQASAPDFFYACDIFITIKRAAGRRSRTPELASSLCFNKTRRLHEPTKARYFFPAFGDSFPAPASALSAS